MRIQKAEFHCGKVLLDTLKESVGEIDDVVSNIKWSKSFTFTHNNRQYEHQTGYNKAFSEGFKAKEWETQPLLRKSPKLIGDFRKGLVFIEVQFGNSSTLYRDYYKFQYGLAEGLLSLAVLIVPVNPKAFFPTRPNSVQNMAEFSLAKTCFSILPLNVPTLLIGLLPEN